MMSEWATMEPNMRKPHRGFVFYRAVLACNANAVCAEECGKATPSVLHLRAFRRQGSLTLFGNLSLSRTEPLWGLLLTTGRLYRGFVVYRTVLACNVSTVMRRVMQS